jgi:hypothetical protein
MMTAEGKTKGMRRILQERGKWLVGMLLECPPCKLGVPHHERRERGYAPGHMFLTVQCCARYCLSREPDFAEQREWLTETCEKQGHSIVFYPKFHCELNFIERIWGFLKARARKYCDYSFNGLKARLPKFVENLPLAYTRKVFRSCFRIMQIYTLGMEGPVLEFASKKYTSHRRIPEGINVDDLKIEFKFFEENRMRRKKCKI